MNQRSIESLIDRGFWLLLIGVCSFGVKFLGDMSRSVDALNGQMMTAITRIERLEQAYTAPSYDPPAPLRRRR